EDQFLHRFRIDAGARHQLADRELAEIERAEARVMRAGFCERRADAANHRDAWDVLPHSAGSLPRTDGLEPVLHSPVIALCRTGFSPSAVSSRACIARAVAPS